MDDLFFDAFARQVVAGRDDAVAGSVIFFGLYRLDPRVG
jgi:hypothetical protein